MCAAVAGVLAGCAARERSVVGVAEEPELTAAQISALVPERVQGRHAWADAIGNALGSLRIKAHRGAACSVIAIIGQESGFAADPAVPGLSKIVKARLDAHADKLGPLGAPILRRLLAGHAPHDTRSFEARLEAARTERDVDTTFRDLLAYHEQEHPTMFGLAEWAGKLLDADSLADLNPVTTAGPMQVSVRFAEQWAKDHGGDPARVRDVLYTREGGVYYGSARLFAHEAAYGEPRFRFADYNAGVYASRNAALQAQVGRLVGRKLALDGDLLSYDASGEERDQTTETLAALQQFGKQHDLDARRVRADARKEKSADLERTPTYRAVKKAYAERFGGEPAYAIIPDVTLQSPKLKGQRSTAWFAESVDRRYRACMAR